MKTYSYLFFLSLLVAALSCSKSDDDNDTSSQAENLIVGTWRPVKEVDGCLNGNETEFPYDECERMSRIDFFESGLFTFSSLAFNTDGVCAIYADGEETWEIINEKLFITDEGQNQEVTYFELENNILRTGYYDDEDCTGGYYYTEYIKD